MAARDEVRRLLEQGLKQKEIAAQLSLTPGRVSQLVKEIRERDAAAPTPPPLSRETDSPPRSSQARPGNRNAAGNRGGDGGPPNNRKAEKTGQHSRLSRWQAFEKACEEAPVVPEAMLQRQAREVYARLRYMQQKLLEVEEAMELLAEGGDAAAAEVLTVIKAAHKEGLNSIGEPTNWTQTESGSLWDRWIEIHNAIGRVERIYVRTAEALKPRAGEINGPTVGALIINNNMPGVD